MIYLIQVLFRKIYSYNLPPEWTVSRSVRQMVQPKMLTLAEASQIFSSQSHSTVSVWFLSQSLMQKDPGQAGESVVTLQRSGPAEPGRGGVSSGGIKGCGR